MNKTLVLFPAVLAFTSFVGPAGVAQPVPPDTKILHDASAVLETEKAFMGLLIVPSVSHGVVTLTGTVSSEGDKVLASVESDAWTALRRQRDSGEYSSSRAHQPEGAQAQALTGRKGASQAAGALLANALTISKWLSFTDSPGPTSFDQDRESGGSVPWDACRARWSYAYF